MSNRVETSSRRVKLRDRLVRDHAQLALFHELTPLGSKRRVATSSSTPALYPQSRSSCPEQYSIGVSCTERPGSSSAYSTAHDNRRISSRRSNFGIGQSLRSKPGNAPMIGHRPSRRWRSPTRATLIAAGAFKFERELNDGMTTSLGPNTSASRLGPREVALAISPAAKPPLARGRANKFPSTYLTLFIRDRGIEERLSYRPVPSDFAD